MAALDVLEPDEWLDFTRLRAIVQATDGNLGAHLETLVRAGYVVIEKLFAGRRPQSRVRPTSTGRQAFAMHVAYLRAMLEGSVQPNRGQEERLSAK